MATSALANAVESQIFFPNSSYNFSSWNYVEKVSLIDFIHIFLLVAI